MFRGNELPRLLTMIAMLGVLLLLMSRAGDPNTWTWVANGFGSSKPAASQPAAAEPAPQHSPSAAADAGGRRPPEAAAEKGAPEKPASEKLAPTGPTDQDREEKDAIEEEFQAVSDGTLSIRPEEMPAYKRLWRWVRNQSFPVLQRRARNNLTFTDLYQTPDKNRGQLVALEFNVRRILQDKLDGIPLYEVWGWTTESKAWPYVAVVMDLPEGMPTGTAVEEQATVVGYFFKLQGYHEAGARPNAPPLRAPLLVGRLVWHPDRVPQTHATDWICVYLLLFLDDLMAWGFPLLFGFLLLLLFGFVVVVIWKGKRQPVFSPPSGVSRVGRPSLEEWLAQPEPAEAADDQTEETNPGAAPEHGGGLDGGPPLSG
jgi:hypothetical protein